MWWTGRCNVSSTPAQPLTTREHKLVVGDGAAVDGHGKAKARAGQESLRHLDAQVLNGGVVEDEVDRVATPEHAHGLVGSLDEALGEVDVVEDELDVGGVVGRGQDKVPLHLGAVHVHDAGEIALAGHGHRLGVCIPGGGEETQ